MKAGRAVVSRISIRTNTANLFKDIDESGVPLHRHSHGGVDTASEGGVDEGHQDGDGLQQGEVLV